MPRVLISDPLDSIASEILTKNNISVDTKTNLSPEELKKIIDNYDGLIIRSATKVRKDLIDSLSNLKKSNGVAASPKTLYNMMR